MQFILYEIFFQGTLLQMERLFLLQIKLVLEEKNTDYCKHLPIQNLYLMAILWGGKKSQIFF